MIIVMYKLAKDLASAVLWDEEKHGVCKLCFQKVGIQNKIYFSVKLDYKVTKRKKDLRSKNRKFHSRRLTIHQTRRAQQTLANESG